MYICSNNDKKELKVVKGIREFLLKGRQRKRIGFTHEFPLPSMIRDAKDTRYILRLS